MHDRNKVRRWNSFTGEFFWDERPFYSPFAWPRWGRIAFLVTLPVSGPLWCVAVAAGWIGTALFMLMIFVLMGPFFALWEFAENMREPDKTED